MSKLPSWRLSEWRTVDLIVVAVLAVSAGVMFVAWNTVYAVSNIVFSLVFPGLQALLDGIWLLGGLLPGLIVRRPGAALIGELIASIVSAVIGNQWGFSVVLLGVLQGLALEAGFAIWRYKSNRFVVVATAGAIGGLVQGISELFIWYPNSNSTFFIVYLASAVLSGAALGGGVACALSAGLRRTGILTTFGR